MGHLYHGYVSLPEGNISGWRSLWCDENHGTTSPWWSGNRPQKAGKFSYIEVSESSKNDPYFQLSDFSWFRTILLIDDFVHELFRTILLIDDFVHELFWVPWTVFFWIIPILVHSVENTQHPYFVPHIPPIWIQCKYNVIHLCRILPVALVNPNFLPSASPLLGLHRHYNPFPLVKAPIFPRNTGRAPLVVSWFITPSNSSHSMLYHLYINPS